MLLAVDPLVVFMRIGISWQLHAKKGGGLVELSNGIGPDPRYVDAVEVGQLVEVESTSMDDCPPG